MFPTRLQKICRTFVTHYTAYKKLSLRGAVQQRVLHTTLPLAGLRRRKDLQDTKAKIPLQEVVVETVTPGSNTLLKFRVCYYDSLYSMKNARDAPVVVGMHGLPSSHKDIYPLVPELEKKGVRVIIPNLPGCGITEAADKSSDDGDKFDYGLYGRTQFLMDFLKFIGVHDADVAVGFSMGSPQTIHMCANTPVFKSLLLMCAIPCFEVPGNSPNWAMQLLASGLNSPLKSIFQIPLHLLFVLKGSEGGKPEYLGRTVIAVSPKGMMHDVMEQNAKKLKKAKFPVVFTYPTRDQFMTVRDMKKYSLLFGAENGKKWVYNGSKRLVQGEMPVNGHYMKVIQFEEADHFPQKVPEYAKILVQEIISLIKHVN